MRIELPDSVEPGDDDSRIRRNIKIPPRTSSANPANKDVFLIIMINAPFSPTHIPLSTNTTVYVLLYMLYSYQDTLPLAQKPVTKICSRRYHEMNYSKFEIEALEFSA
jgi:hypothetical protein